MRTVYREDGHSGVWTAPRTGNTPVTLEFVGGVARVNDADFDRAANYFEANGFFAVDDQPDPTPEPVADPEPAAEDLFDLSVAELRKRLRAAGLPVSGTKAELVDRLGG